MAQISEDQIRDFVTENNFMQDVLPPAQAELLVRQLVAESGRDPNFQAKFSRLQGMDLSFQVVAPGQSGFDVYAKPGQPSLADGLTGKDYTLQVAQEDIGKPGFSLLDATIQRIAERKEIDVKGLTQQIEINKDFTGAADPDAIAALDRAKVDLSDFNRLAGGQPLAPVPTTAPAAGPVDEAQIRAFVTENNRLMNTPLSPEHEELMVMKLMEESQTDPKFGEKFQKLKGMDLSFEVVQGGANTRATPGHPALMDGMTGHTYTMQIDARDLGTEGFSVMDATMGQIAERKQGDIKGLSEQLEQGPSDDTPYIKDRLDKAKQDVADFNQLLGTGATQPAARPEQGLKLGAPSNG